MQINQQGTVRTGAHGKITEVYTNGGRFKADNGVEYTILTQEFTADDATPAEAADIKRAQAALFGHITEGFEFGQKRDADGHVVEFWMLPLAHELPYRMHDGLMFGGMYSGRTTPMFSPDEK